ncbi:hypothetical protein [uncultured Methanolobus sp.]|uniref:hypothetical protein n=1 Tax=uncultured Methanolobus sp. TaxID=218300 RepID=UPI0029C8771B|nr:hypothetical protein [uncultured Methanolobus sp.]
MKDEKKEYLVRKEMYAETVKKNKKLGLVNMVIFSIGLILKYIGMPELGGHFIWLGIILLVYVFGSNMMAKYDMKKYELK